MEKLAGVLNNRRIEGNEWEGGEGQGRRGGGKGILRVTLVFSIV